MGMAKRTKPAAAASSRGRACFIMSMGLLSALIVRQSCGSRVRSGQILRFRAAEEIVRARGIIERDRVVVPRECEVGSQPGRRPENDVRRAVDRRLHNWIPIPAVVPTVIARSAGPGPGGG